VSALAYTKSIEQRAAGVTATVAMTTIRYCDQAGKLVAVIVMGRPKPATSGRAKTGHFEIEGIRRDAVLSVLAGSGQQRWRISSRWLWFRTYRRYRGHHT
jgi:hypothetical protein